MYNDFSVKEVNAYYARRGGIRTANISNYANVGSFSNIMRQMTTQRTVVAQESAANSQNTSAQNTNGTRTTVSTRATSGLGLSSGNNNTANRIDSALYGNTTSRTGSTTQNNHTSQTSQSARNSDAAPTDTTAARENNGNICCDKCQLTNQMMLQMMSRNLYTQSSLGYPLTGAGAWTAYQNMANILGSGLYR